MPSASRIGVVITPFRQPFHDFMNHPATIKQRSSHQEPKNCVRASKEGKDDLLPEEDSLMQDLIELQPDPNAPVQVVVSLDGELGQSFI